MTGKDPLLIATSITTLKNKVTKRNHNQDIDGQGQQKMEAKP